MNAAALEDLSLWQRAEVEPDRIAVVDPDGSTKTFAQFADEARRMANVFTDFGLRRGDSVAVMLRNSSTVLELIGAALETGLYYTPINFRLHADDIAYLLADTEARIFVTEPEFAASATAALALMADPPLTLSTGPLEGCEDLRELMAGAANGPPPGRSLGARMYYTSGTTGRPKGVRRPLPEGDVDEGAVRHGLGLHGRYNTDPEGPFLHCGPMYHASPMGYSFGALNLGKTVVVTDRFDAEECLGLIQQWRCVSTHMVPTMFVRFLKLDPAVRESYDVSSLQVVVHAAAPCPVDVKRRMMDWLGPIVYEYYASTEGAGGAHVGPHEWLAHPGTVGKVDPDNLVAMDDEGNVLPRGTPGVLYARRAPQLSFEYFKDPEKTAAARRGEWVTVGDIGYIDDQDYLYLVDRRAETINAGGVNIYPAETEAVLLQHPAVADACVIGIPNEEWGEEVKAVVQLLAPATASDELAADLMAFCRAHAPSYRCPRSIDLVEELPRDDNGKLYRRRVRDPYWEGRSRRI
jgi:long-chain acyl-CoA synthetase